jgi:hypothetical protein
MDLQQRRTVLYVVDTVIMFEEGIVYYDKGESVRVRDGQRSTCPPRGPKNESEI